MPRKTISSNALVAFLVAAMLVNATWASRAAAEPEQEKDAVTAIRRFTTNMQFNRDGTVRLVRLSKPVVNDEALVPLRAFSQIDYLAIVCPEVTDAGLEHVRDLTNLDTLLLAESGISDDGLRALAKLNKLERLYLQDTKVTDDGLQHLAPLTNLRVLSLERTQVTGAGLRHLGRLPNLEALLLDGTAVSDAGLAHLAGLSKLKFLFLDGTDLSGPGLEHLATLKNLEHLSLSGLTLRNCDLRVFQGLSHLKHLELYHTDLPQDDIAGLREQLPKTAIYTGRMRPAVDTPITAVAEQAKTASEFGRANTNTSPLPCAPPIVTRLAEPDFVPDFQRHVVPLLGRLGCNGRSCHGSFQGRGGFRLSMFGYDFAMDHENLSARIDLDAPAKSLILNKPASAEEHEGGQRFAHGSWQQQLLRRWIAAGAKGVADDAARFVRLEVTPAEIVFDHLGDSVQLQCIAVWSDGSREDVTSLARFETKDDGVAEVTPEGRITAVGTGDTYVISLYDNGIFSSQVILPVSDKVGPQYPQVPVPTRIDELVAAKLAKLGVVPSELSSDEMFLRRVSLDMIGTLPTPSQILQFAADPSPDKRARKIEELLEHPAYVTWWTQKFCDLTGSNAGYLGSTEMAQPVAAQWRDWMERRVRDNTGWDEIVKGIVLATSRSPGQPYHDFTVEQSGYTRRVEPADFAAAGNPMPHFWYRSNLGQPADKALAFGYIFLGVRLQCAQCHKHPYDQWSKQDFEKFTEFFTRIQAGTAPDAVARRELMREMFGVPVKLNTAALRRQSYLRIAAEGKPIPWKEIYIDPPPAKPQIAKLLGGAELDLRQYDDPRQPLMDWLLHEPQRYFAKAFVNRIWANYFHVGIIDPPDDLNLANPPSNKPLLDDLADRFVASGYDIRWLHRTITNSRTYQLSWLPNDTNRTDQRNFSHAIVRRLPAEVAVDAMIQATAGDARLEQLYNTVAGRKIGDHPRSYQARVVDYSLLIFGKPLRTTNCDCERQGEPTLLQSLYVRNDKEMLERIDRSDGWIAQLEKQQSNLPPLDDLIGSAYLRTLSRRPTEIELADSRQHIQTAESPLEGFRDLMWALLNTQEFITNH